MPNAFSPALDHRTTAAGQAEPVIAIATIHSARLGLARPIRSALALIVAQNGARRHAARAAMLSLAEA